VGAVPTVPRVSCPRMGPSLAARARAAAAAASPNGPATNGGLFTGAARGARRKPVTNCSARRVNVGAGERHKTRRAAPPAPRARRGDGLGRAGGCANARRRRAGGHHQLCVSGGGSSCFCQGVRCTQHGLKWCSPPGLWRHGNPLQGSRYERGRGWGTGRGPVRRQQILVQGGTHAKALD
jgi:hypothetical protein